MVPILKVRDKDGVVKTIAVAAVPSLLAAHADSHKAGGSDPLTHADIGAAPAEHSHHYDELAGVAPAEHTHDIADVVGLDTYVTELVAMLTSPSAIWFTASYDLYPAISGMRWNQFVNSAFNTTSKHDKNSKTFRINGNRVEILAKGGEEEPFWSYLCFGYDPDANDQDDWIHVNSWDEIRSDVYYWAQD